MAFARDAAAAAEAFPLAYPLNFMTKLCKVCEIRGARVGRRRRARRGRVTVQTCRVIAARVSTTHHLFSSVASAASLIKRVVGLDIARRLGEVL
jgi:hypothetical protein